MSYGKAGVAFTIAAIILISGLYVRFSFTNPYPQAALVEDAYPYYKDFKTLTFGVASKSTTTKTFESEKNQKLSLNLNFANTGPSPSQTSSATRTVINVTDSKGEQIVYENNVGPNYSIQPIQVKNSGSVSVAITNQEDSPLSVTMYVRQSGQPPSFGFDNGILNFSNWLMIVSTPVFALGIWLVVSEHRKKNASDHVPASPNPPA